MITLTITDTQDSMTFNAFQLQSPVVADPAIIETDVQTLDGNISTYFTAIKKQYEFKPVFMDADSYAQLKGFRDRQYTNYKYPVITITGDGLNASNITAKMTLSGQQTVDNCGFVDNITVSFRESKQM